MEIVAVIDEPLAPANAASLDRKVFCIDECGWCRTPGLLGKFLGAVSGGRNFSDPDGTGRGIPMRNSAAFAERDLKRLAVRALANPKEVNLHFLVDGDSDARDLIAYYQAAAMYVVQSGGALAFYGKWAGGPFAELSMLANTRFLLDGSRLTFRNPIPAVGTLDFVNDMYWRNVKEFLLRNVVEGMRERVKGLLSQIEKDPANVQREVSISAEEAWDMGLSEEPLKSVDDLCRAFEMRCGECVENFSHDHPVKQFFDVDEREARYMQPEKPVLRGLPGGGGGNDSATLSRIRHLRLVK